MPAAILKTTAFTLPALLCILPAACAPEAGGFSSLIPGESGRDDVVAALGEPLKEFNLYTDGDDVVPVQLPRNSKRYGPDGEVRALLRVLEYDGDERRDYYAAVLRNDVLFSTLEPVPPGERAEEAVREVYGEPEVQVNRTFHGNVLRAVQVFAYDDAGVAFVREHGDEFVAKVRYPQTTSPRVPGVVVEYMDSSRTGRQAAPSEDTEGAFDELEDEDEE